MNKRDLYIKAKAPAEDWNRPSDWLPMPTGITSTDQIFVGLHAVIEDSDNFCAFRFTVSGGNQYQVDWGDGTIDLINSNVNAEHQYDYNDPALDGTLTSRGYKQTMITVTPVSGNLLTCNFQQRFVTSPVQNQAYSTGFLDCILSMPNASSGQSIVFGGSTVRHTYVERVNVLTIGAATSMIAMFQNCQSIQSVPLFNTVNVTNMGAMFLFCLSIKTIPFFNTGNVTDMVNVFNTCLSLKLVPQFNTQNVQSFQNAFSSCQSIQSIPLLNTASATNMAAMFNNCISLNSIPLLNTSSIPLSGGLDFGNFANGANSLNRCQMVFQRTVSFQNCQLSRDAIVEIFNNLINRSATTSATITITGNWGVTALSSEDLLIATNKNWVVTS